MPCISDVNLMSFGSRWSPSRDIAHSEAHLTVYYKGALQLLYTTIIIIVITTDL